MLTRGQGPYQLFAIVVPFNDPVIGDSHRDDEDVWDCVGGQCVNHHREKPSPGTGGFPTPGACAFQKNLQELLLSEQFNYMLGHKETKWKMNLHMKQDCAT